MILPQADALGLFSFKKLLYKLFFYKCYPAEEPQLKRNKYLVLNLQKYFQPL